MELTVGVLRRHPVCTWWGSDVLYDTRILVPGVVRPATVRLSLDDDPVDAEEGVLRGSVTVQAPEALQPDADLRADVLAAWHAWRAGQV